MQIATDRLETILGALVVNSPFEVKPTQRDAWITEINQLQVLAQTTPGAHFFLEFSIPRMGRRADVVILWRGVLFVVEYKVGDDEYSSRAIDQVLGYALDLKNFHETSHYLKIVPVLLATEAPAVPITVCWDEDQVAVPVTTNSETFRAVLEDFTKESTQSVDPISWETGRYRPTPTIIIACAKLSQPGVFQNKIVVACAVTITPVHDGMHPVD